MAGEGALVISRPAVIPAKSGIQPYVHEARVLRDPACGGTTDGEFRALENSHAC